MLNDKFTKASIMLFTASIVSNLFNYIFQLAMSRFLSTEDFGLINALLSLLMIMSLPIVTIMTVLAKYVSNFNSESEYGNIRALFFKAYKNILSMGLLLLIIFLCLSSVIQNYLKIASITPIIFLHFTFFTSLILPINIAFLQGLQKFVSLSLVTGIYGPTKFLFCLIFILLGLRVNGVLSGIILTNAAFFLISIYPLRKHITVTARPQEKENKIFLYAIPVFVANLCFAGITQIDLVLVRHYFPPIEVGIYASAAVLGRAIMYLPSTIILAMFPMVAEARAKNQRATKLLAKALTYTVALSGTGIILYYLFPDMIINILFGNKYIQAAPLLGRYGLAMLPMGVLLILINYYLAQSQLIFPYFLILPTILQIILIVFFHQSLFVILWIIFACGILSILSILVSNRIKKKSFFWSVNKSEHLSQTEPDRAV